MLSRDLVEQQALREQDLVRQELLEARQAVLTERSRIARELHDVVAHHMSMIAIQAQAAPYKIPDLPPPALETFAAIRGASTTALTEMRRVIGLLRDESEDAERVPQPGLDGLDELVKGARAAGMSVELTITRGPQEEVPLGVDVSAFRIVQESLSNASRHAPGARTFVGSPTDRRLCSYE
ncbi:sensor histidine kinase [Fodinicola feengrottensis]|uniref:sensor histidine kinase n=1 Tax=Fodinicola feengrottensis TaxID=435914 RepID=UPI0013D87920|nr:histidine kinase [Fodinicola feengrottensis]